MKNLASRERERPEVSKRSPYSGRSRSRLAKEINKEIIAKSREQDLKRRCAERTTVGSPGASGLDGN
jgi:hypothetical protein